MKGVRNSAIVFMNKQRNRYTPFKGEYRMPVDVFCAKYGLDLKCVMHRMNVLYWEDFDALVIPQNLGDTSADKIRRALILIEREWDKETIMGRLGIDEVIYDNICNMTPYLKEVFKTMDHYFFLNPENVDLDQVFVEVDNY